MDALSDVLRVAHLTGGVFLHAEFFAPWCIAARIPREHCGPLLGPASHLIIYHYVIEGELHIRLDGHGADEEDVIIGGGEIVVLPRNDLASDGQRLAACLRCWVAISSSRPRVADCTPFTGGSGQRTDGVRISRMRQRRRQSDRVHFAVRAEPQGRKRRSSGMDPVDISVRGIRGRRRPDRIRNGAVQALGVAVRGGRAAVRPRLPRGQTGWLAGLREPGVFRGWRCCT